MTGSYKIRYLGTAEKDLIEIFEYIKRDNPSAAESQLDRFDSAIARLTTHPFLGVIPKDDRLKRLGYRMLVVDRVSGLLRCQKQYRTNPPNHPWRQTIQLSPLTTKEERSLRKNERYAQSLNPQAPSSQSLPWPASR